MCEKDFEGPTNLYQFFSITIRYPVGPPKYGDAGMGKRVTLAGLAQRVLAVVIVGTLAGVDALVARHDALLERAHLGVATAHVTARLLDGAAHVVDALALALVPAGRSRVRARVVDDAGAARIIGRAPGAGRSTRGDDPGVVGVARSAVVTARGQRRCDEGQGEEEKGSGAGG